MMCMFRVTHENSRSRCRGTTKRRKLPCRGVGKGTGDLERKSPPRRYSSGTPFGVNRETSFHGDGRFRWNNRAWNFDEPLSTDQEFSLASPLPPSLSFLNLSLIPRGFFSFPVSSEFV
ncbi:hypothetical protein NPIL_470161 [Nephila pilipes]|uniref:Uncharacterized protein n=1 Tax=Nephila pilipes TaxID=299642 RepID=A0A8X6NG53_NEPPI|nr:hypothetical protein NPIL_470161 [Nephila pilipes]